MAPTTKIPLVANKLVSDTKLKQTVMTREDEEEEEEDEEEQVEENIARGARREANAGPSGAAARGPRLELPADLPPVVITETRLGPKTVRLQAAEPPGVFQLAMANLLANPTFTYIDPAGAEPPKRERGEKGNKSGRKRSQKGKSRRRRRMDKFIRRKIRECKAAEERKQKEDQERIEEQVVNE